MSDKDIISEIRKEKEKLFPSKLSCWLYSLEITYSLAYFLPEAIKPKSVYWKNNPKEIQTAYIAKISGVFDKKGIARRFKDILSNKFKKLNK